MVLRAPAPLTRASARRDVNLFLGSLVGFLVVLIFVLLLVLRTNLSRTEEMIAASERTVADVVAGELNRGDAAALDTQLLYLRGRFDIAGIEVKRSNGSRVTSGAAEGDFDTVRHLAGPGMLTLRFDASRRRAARRGFLLTAGISITAASLGAALLFLYLREKSSLEARVQEMTTLAQLGEISAGIAHEFRSSLTTILGYMKLARKTGLDEVTETRLQRAENEAQLLLQAIERLLAFARPVELNAEDVDLHALLSEQIEQIADVGDGVPVTLEGPRVTIRGDRILLSRALENLLRNAADAVRQKGSGSIAVTLRDAPPTVTIRDEGVGFDPAEGPRLFLPFQSNKPNGFGMGLPLAKKIILVHGGTLQLTGQPDGGAVATVTFGA